MMLFAILQTRLKTYALCQGKDKQQQKTNDLNITKPTSQKETRDAHRYSNDN
jgi:hypothetical protein